MPTVGTLVAGGIRTDTTLAAKVPVNMDRHIHLQETSKYLFEYLVRSIRKSKAETNMRVDFLEQRPHPLTVTGTAVEAAGETSIAVGTGTGTYAHADDLLYNTRTNEMYLVASVSASAIVVANHVGSGGITLATAVGDIFLILPEAHAEGEAIPAAYSQQPVEVQTYIMQSDSVRANTDIQRATAEYGEKQLLIDRKLKWIEYKRGKDLLMYLGQNMREVASAGGPRRHTSRGIRQFISTNKIDFGSVPGGLTLPTVAELMRRTMSYSASSDTKVGVCGQNSWAQISAMPNNAIRTTVSETDWGKRLNTLVTGHGNLAVGYDPMLKQENGLADIFVIFDPQHICHAHLAGQPERLMLNVENSNDIHNQTDVITGTFGLLLYLEELHAWGFGIS